MRLQHISETIRRNDNPYVKFAGEYHGTNRFPKAGQRQFTAIPGYCVRLHELIEVWRKDRSILVPYDGSLYEVTIDHNTLWPMPKFVTTIVGYAGPPTIKMPNELLELLWDYDLDTAIRVAKDHSIKVMSPRQFQHDAMRSVEPGVRSDGHSGYKTEIIVNVSCPMRLISLPDIKTDKSGYTVFKLHHKR